MEFLFIIEVPGAVRNLPSHRDQENYPQSALYENDHCHAG